ncbi:ankyrin repeat domain-containing protein [Xanthomonadaceae bacterium JHOS43]|nr:ankyrin repeat domain-containing protein [Xanthomonadaceae bacterium JHOS43]
MTAVHASSERSSLTARVAAFAPPVVLTLLAWLPMHPAFVLGPVLAFPLYLIAAATWLGIPAGTRFAPLLLRQVRGGIWLALAMLAALASTLVWPAMQLTKGGGLVAVLSGSAIIGLAWVLIWRRAVVLALLLEPADEPVSARRHALGEAACIGLAGWISAMCLLLLALATLGMAWAQPWAVEIRHVALLAHALLLAPALACAALAASWHQLEQARHRVVDALTTQTLATPQARTYTPGPSVDAAVYSAARAGRVDEALALLDMGANPYAMPAPDARDQRTLPMLAAVLSDLRLLRALIAAGADLNLAHAGLTPLMAAVRDSYHGRPDAVLMLLTNGADPRPPDASGQTPLHAAARAAEPSIAALLLDAGAPLDALDAQGTSPLGIAAGLGNLDVAKYLIDRRAACEPKGGEPALLLAAAREDDDPAMVKLLLRHKARVDARGRLGRTALHAACLKGNPRIVDALLHAGAHPDLADEHGVTPLLEAARAGATACVDRLATQGGVDPSVRDHVGRNALAIACQASHCDTDTVKALLALGVDPQQAAADGRRAIDHAVAAGRWAHVALLDPGYVLPACLTENDEELQDAPPLMRLRLALDRESFSTARQLLPIAIGSQDELAALYLDLAPRLGRGAANVLAANLDSHATDTEGSPIIWHLLALGPGAHPALWAMLERGAAPVGRGSLARYLNAALLHADTRADAQQVALALLERGADPFTADADGSPPLLQALRLKWPLLLDALLARGVDPDTRDTFGATALMLACQFDDEAAVRRLIMQGAQPSARTPDGQTARGLALSLGRPHLSRWMDWSQWRLPRRALRDGDLVSAAQRGDAEAVERLLDLGLAINAVDAQGCTALLRACGGGHVGLVRHLLARGADAGAPAHSGATCLSVALTARQIDVVWTLAEHGIAIDQRLPGGITPLMIAAALGQDQAIGALLAHGADPKASDDHGGSVLHALAQFGFGARDPVPVVAAWNALLVAGADADTLNAVGETPLLLLLGASFEPGTACREDVLLAQLDLLLRHGVNLHARERRGFGPLHLAALHGLARVVRRLLAAGADPDLRDTLNRRPAEIALMRGYVDIAAEFTPDEPAPSIARFLREPGS